MKERHNILYVRRVLGFRKNCKLTLEQLKKVCKEQIINARRNTNDDMAATLSEVYQILKRRTKGPNRCLVCKRVVAPSATRCMMHARIELLYRRQLA